MQLSLHFFTSPQIIKKGQKPKGKKRHNGLGLIFSFYFYFLYIYQNPSCLGTTKPIPFVVMHIINKIYNINLFINYI